MKSNQAFLSKGAIEQYLQKEIPAKAKLVMTLIG
jgi:hypothetical protein